MHATKRRSEIVARARPGGRVVVTDSSKFGRDSFDTFAQISDLHTIITGTSAPRSSIATIRAMGVQVVQT